MGEDPLLKAEKFLEQEYDELAEGLHEQVPAADGYWGQGQRAEHQKKKNTLCLVDSFA